MDVLADIARAVLYEGYLLWPYRRAATKNQQRWTFGGVYPRAHSVATAGTDRSSFHTECLVEGSPRGPSPQVDVCVRFLHVVRRQVMRDVDGVLEPVDALTVRGEQYLSWEEAVEREVTASVVVPDPGREDPPSTNDPAPDRPGPHRGGASEVAITIAPASHVDFLFDADGRRAGAIVRCWESIDGTLSAGACCIDPQGVYRVHVTVTNTASWPGGSRQDAVRHTLVSTHVVLHVRDGAFVSLLDPGDAYATAAATCRNEGVWPVLVGAPGARDTMLASPIIMYDYPRVAPESPGDLFDGGEIDQLLILNILTLTDEERQEMRDSDPLAREILDRCTALSPGDLMRLHGVIRAMSPVSPPVQEGESCTT